MTSHDNDFDAISSSPPVSGTPPFPPSTQVPQTAKRELPLSVTDFLAQHFPQFDHQSAVLEPFSEGARRDAAFQEELVIMLLKALLETHAWANARVDIENNRAAERFEQKISGFMMIEKEQERTRERLLEFINNIKNAIVALTRAVLH